MNILPICLTAAGPVLLALLSVLPGCGKVDLDLSMTFQEAQELFNSASTEEEFTQSAMLFQRIIDSGCTSGAVFYNMGNAFMNANKRGLAIAAYRQAKRYRPRDPFLDANFRFALGPDAPVETRRSLVGHLLFWQEWISYPEKFFLATLAAGFSLLFALASLYAGNKTLWRRLVWTGLILTLVLSVSAGYDWYRFEWIRNGVIIGEEVTARKGNSESFQPAFTDSLAEGQEFRVLDQRADWLLIRVMGGLEGWIPSEDAMVF